MITASGSPNGILDIRVIVKALSMVINNSINTEHDENHIKIVPYTIHNPSPNIHVPVTVAMKVKGRHETVNNISLIDNDAMKALVTELKRRCRPIIYRTSEFPNIDRKNMTARQTAMMTGLVMSMSVGVALVRFAGAVEVSFWQHPVEVFHMVWCCGGLPASGESQLLFPLSTTRHRSISDCHSPVPLMMAV